MRLGKLNVSPLCLGGNVFGWTADPATSDQILDAFVAGGGNFIDTADTYSSWVPGHTGGESERILGVWLRNRSSVNKLVIATKVAKHPRYRGLRPANIKVALDGSRRRLGMDTIDLYYAHEDDPNVPIAEWVGTFTDLIAQGAIKSYGISNFTTARTHEVIATALAQNLALPIAIQPEYNLVHRSDVETGKLDAVAAEHKIAILPYYSLAGGFLTGKYHRDDPLRGSRASTVKKYATPAGFDVVDTLCTIAETMDAEPATVALAWLRQQHGTVIPIASASTPEQVATLLPAMTLKLGRADFNKLTKVSAAFL